MATRTIPRKEADLARDIAERVAQRVNGLTSKRWSVTTMTRKRSFDTGTAPPSWKSPSIPKFYINRLFKGAPASAREDLAEAISAEILGERTRESLAARQRAHLWYLAAEEAAGGKR